ncbi:hypothetical protein [Allokutzneria albata]|uniref:hypothetical protein n=1 Tax=Allokutzneria albata TaxID=211114 RepID=UPI0009DDEC69|nr:hypothetical protein [Allokutzneria albata]
MTGTLRVTGNPGGLFHLSEGAVVAVDSPGSPKAETLLLSSGRISDEDWAAVLREGVESRARRAALVARGILTSGEVEAVVLEATQDGVFATVAGDIEQCVVVEDETVDVLLTAPDGVAPELLLPETIRRLDELASMPFPLSPYRECVVPGGGAEAAAPGEEERSRILANADGRRTARDIAFAVGRGVHPVTVEISRMLAEGLLEIAPPAVAVVCSHQEITSLERRAKAARVAAPGADRASPLPVRRPGPPHRMPGTT